MPTPRFIQIHSLTAHPAALLDRDDAGLAKRLSYGGTVRTRISSQRLERHWRTADDAFSLRAIPGLTEDDFATRSRRHFMTAIAQPLLRAGFAKDAVVEVVNLLASRVIKGASEARAGNGGAVDAGAGSAKGARGKRARRAVANGGGRGLRCLETKQELLLTSSEILYLVAIATRLLEGDAPLWRALEEAPKNGRPTPYQAELRRNIAEFARYTRVPASVDAALFGRIVASDVLANTDAALHVAHAFTVHQQDSETNYLTVVDDLEPGDQAEDAGSTGMFDTELTTGLYYGYAVIDVPLLVSNLTGVDAAWWMKKEVDRELPAKVVEHLLHLIATSSPGARKGSTAPYALAHTLLVEAGSHEPRPLASAFETALTATCERSLAAAAEDALFDRLAAFDRTYGACDARRYLSLRGTARANARGPESLDALAGWAAECVRAAES